ncbi:MAG: DNA polymerase III subunit chi [Oceanospirillaceae bacterium]|nr:DNA polymerase III subunit chi [Oceanospirillaceae bacterium]
MPRADYYVLPQSDYDSRELFVCRLCDKLLRQNLKIHVHLRSEADLRQLDQRLWSFRPEAFLPHTILGSEIKAPITLSTDEAAQLDADVLVNLGVDAPQNITQVERIAEIVVQDPEILSAARESFKQRRDAGWEVHNHKLSS